MCNRGELDILDKGLHRILFFSGAKSILQRVYGFIE